MEHDVLGSDGFVVEGLNVRQIHVVDESLVRVMRIIFRIPVDLNHRTVQHKGAVVHLSLDCLSVHFIVTVVLLFDVTLLVARLVLKFLLLFFFVLFQDLVEL